MNSLCIILDAAAVKPKPFELVYSMPAPVEQLSKIAIKITADVVQDIMARYAAILLLLSSVRVIQVMMKPR